MQDQTAIETIKTYLSHAQAGYAGAIETANECVEALKEAIEKYETNTRCEPWVAIERLFFVVAEGTKKLSYARDDSFRACKEEEMLKEIFSQLPGEETER